jgi:tetrahydromethanopterin S-methyltransferase subunit G
MSAIEDMRKVLQDFLAPELRSVHARLDAMDEKLQAQSRVTEARFQEVFARIDGSNERIDNVKTSLEARIENVKSSLEVRLDVTNDRIDSLKTSLDLDKRVGRLESSQSHPSA